MNLGFRLNKRRKGALNYGWEGPEGKMDTGSCQREIIGTTGYYLLVKSKFEKKEVCK